jgi:hypothetical protein
MITPMNRYERALVLLLRLDGIEERRDKADRKQFQAARRRLAAG